MGVALEATVGHGLGIAFKAQILTERGEEASALKLLEAATRDHPRTVMLWVLLVEAYEKNQMLEQAFGATRRAEAALLGQSHEIEADALLWLREFIRRLRPKGTEG